VIENVRLEQERRSINERSLQLVPRAANTELLQKFIDDLGEWIASEITDPSWPSTASVAYDAVCSHLLGLGASLIPDIAAVTAAAELTFLSLAIPTGPLGWVAALGFSIVLNLILAEAFPQIYGAITDACNALKPCQINTEIDFLTDASNCGGCGIKVSPATSHLPPSPWLTLPVHLRPMPELRLRSPRLRRRDLLDIHGMRPRWLLCLRINCRRNWYLRGWPNPVRWTADLQHKCRLRWWSDLLRSVLLRSERVCQRGIMLC
jgi:hypothetical protein